MNDLQPIEEADDVSCSSVLDEKQSVHWRGQLNAENLNEENDDDPSSKSIKIYYEDDQSKRTGRSKISDLPTPWTKSDKTGKIIDASAETPWTRKAD